MHLHVDAVVSIEDGWEVRVRGVSRGLLGISPLAIYICESFS